MEETFRTQFKNLANDILGEQSRTFKETNREALDVLLKPFRDNIVEFRERVEKIYSSENEQRGALRNELERLMELNRRITTETTNLTNALKGNSKVQGDWGEMILETILDNSNLIRGVHYDTQLNIKDEAGNNLRPDVVLYLPEGKRIVIDSKVSLTAFVGYVGAEDEATRRQYLASHVASVRQHVVELGRKEYQRLLDSPDFVIMFIPNEPAFLAALQNDSSIWADAYDKKVIISSPTNLFALLKLVDDLGSGTHRTRIRPTSLLTVRNSTSSWWLSPLRSKGWDSRSTPPGTSITMPTSGFAPVTTTSSAAGSGFANWEFRPRNNSLPGLCRRPIYRTKSNFGRVGIAPARQRCVTGARGA